MYVIGSEKRFQSTHTNPYNLKTVVIMLLKAVLIQLTDKSSYVFDGFCNRPKELTCNIYPMGEENMAASSANLEQNKKKSPSGWHAAKYFDSYLAYGFISFFRHLSQWRSYRH